MAFSLRSADHDRATSFVANTLVIGAVCIAGLYLMRELWVPLALAVLLSFVLTPAVALLRRWRFPRVAAVLVSVLVAGSAVLTAGWIVGREASQLAKNFPLYEQRLHDKLKILRGSSIDKGVIDRATDALKGLKAELSGKERNSATTIDGVQRPIPVEVHQPEKNTIDILGSIIPGVLHPLAVTGLVIVLVIFILLQREDLRNRILRLVGTHDLNRTTAAMDDAASRLSRLFFVQVVTNASFGLAIGLGVWMIGIPNSWLWGSIAGIMRFVPFVGGFVAAALPLLLAAAIDPGWSAVLAVLALYLVGELLMGQVVEPWLYGPSAGLSPIAVIICAAFWTFLWGPIGLVLAIPLTVCLVVLGRHVEGLGFLEVLFGDQPVLQPEHVFYQRALSGDTAELVEQTEIAVKETSLWSYFDDVAVPALRLAQTDYARGALSESQADQVRKTIEELVDALTEENDVELRSSNENRQVMCVSSGGALDEAGALLFVALLAMAGIVPQTALGEIELQQQLSNSEANPPEIICVVHGLSGLHQARARYLVRRLRKRMPTVRIMSVLLGDNEQGMEPVSEETTTNASTIAADYIANSLGKGIAFALEMTRGMKGVITPPDRLARSAVPDNALPHPA